jgi:hypothetical protein
VRAGCLFFVQQCLIPKLALRVLNIDSLALLLLLLQ